MNNSEMKLYKQEVFTGERALFKSDNLAIYDSIFEDGESPLKESKYISLYNSVFRWKYPLWYCDHIELNSCTLFETARAGIWYTDQITVKDTVIEAPKSFRRCSGVNLKNVNFPNAAETLWNCSHVNMENITAKGDYFAMNCSNINADNLTLTGNYSFDGAKNIEIHNSRLLSKDAFWNSENVVVFDSFISGEYLGWNSKNLTFINCTIESLQGLCYIDNLVMKNCKTIATNLAFEYSLCDVEIVNRVDSIKNPIGGVIRAESAGEVIMEPDKVDVDATKIIIGD